MNGLFPKKNIEEKGGGGRGHGISRSVEKIKCGQEKAITEMIKKKPCGIYTSLGYCLWNFQGV